MASRTHALCGAFRLHNSTMYRCRRACQPTVGGKTHSWMRGQALQAPSSTPLQLSLEFAQSARNVLLGVASYLHASQLLMCDNACRSRGKAVQVHVFKEDSHALDQPETAFVQWPRILAFFRMHLQDK